MMTAIETKQAEAQTRPGKPGPVRACAGCGKRVPADELVRVVLDSTGAPESPAGVVADLAGSAFGRGAHVHPSPECVKKALRGGFSRAFKTKVEVSPEGFGAQLVALADRRIQGLLMGAKRGGHLVVGGDVVREALAAGSAELLVVARDAASAAKLSGVNEAIAGGKAIAWNDKKQLGALFGRDEVAVCAVTHPGLAAAISGAFRASRPFVGSEAWWSPEVR